MRTGSHGSAGRLGRRRLGVDAGIDGGSDPSAVWSRADDSGIPRTAHRADPPGGYDRDLAGGGGIPSPRPGGPSVAVDGRNACGARPWGASAKAFANLLANVW